MYEFTILWLIVMLSPHYVFCDITFTGVNPTVVIPNLGTVLGETMLFDVVEYPAFTGEVDVYRGIPYALPPVDDLRFAKPVKFGAFSPEADYNATYFRSSCIQAGQEESRERQSEDCLYLNVWVPKSKPENATVMVWIHGGGFVFGSASSPGYNGVPLSVINNIIYVTISYRLNSFGFLSLGDDVMPGNYGLFDQQMALKWTKENIAAFGGNADDITIFGESAGAASVGLHLVSPNSWEYFTKAIMQSGSALAPWGLEYDSVKARQDAYGVAERAGCDDFTNHKELLGCLRDLPAANLSEATTFVLLRTVTNVIPFVPVIDGDFVPGNPWTLLKNNQFKQCDILVGSNLDDGSLISARAYPEELARRFPVSEYDDFRDTIDNYIYTYHNDLILDTIEQQYINWKIADDPDTNYFYTYMELITDEAFACPVDGTARAHIKSGNTVYMYQMTYKPSTSVWPDIPSWKGVAHAEDMQFVFGYHFIPDEEHEMTPIEQDMSIQTMKYWTNFAKTGNPNLSSKDEVEEDTPTTWRAYSTPDLHYKFLHPDFLGDQALKTQACHLWNDHLPKMVTFTAELEDVEMEWKEEFSRWKYTDMPNWKTAFEGYKSTINTCDGGNC